MSLRYDRSWNSVVIVCDQCPHWSAVRLTMPAAYEAGEAHEVSVHGVEPTAARAARRLYEKRHAAHA
jgi:hypothetical protein